MRAFVFKPKGSRIWRGRYKLDADTKGNDVSLHTSDKQVAGKRLRELISEREMEAGGMLAVKAVRSAATCKLSEHLDAYLRDLGARGRDSMYTYNIERRIEKLLNECGWEYLKDITPDAFTSWRAAQTSKAPKTLNEYLDAVSGLLNWMQRLGRIVANPLASVGKVQTRGREVRHRRALTDNEVRSLLAVARPSRRALYLLAVTTGLRKAELEALTWGDVSMSESSPTIRARASTTKNHKEAVLPLHGDALAAIREIFPSVVDSLARVFEDIPRPEQFRADLKKAGIPYKDAQGRQADFHALRHTLATNLARSGVSPRVAMEIMRHSDMRLTQSVYTDATQLGTSAAVNSLPSLLPQIASPVLGASGLSLSQADTTPFSSDHAKESDSKGFGHDLAPTGTDGLNGSNGCRTRIRT